MMIKSRLILKGLGIFFLVLTLFLVTAAPVLAFDTRSGTNVTIGSGEVINSDLYLFGTNITIDGTVNGDVFAFGQYVLINGTINGGLTTVGQNVTLNGQVSRGVRALGETVNVEGNIERDLVVAGNTVNVTGSARIGGDLAMAASTSTISGSIGGNIKADGTKITIGDGVGGNANLTMNEITITSAADIKGNLVYTSQNDATIQTGAKIGGTTSHQLPEPSRSFQNFFIVGIVGNIIGRTMAFLMLFIIGVIIIVTAPRNITALADSLRTSPASSLGWGALLLFITPIAAFIVMFTVIGLPLGFISLVLWGIAIYLSEIPVALIIGWLILRNNQNLESKGIVIGAFALGLFIVSLITAIPIIGWLIWLFVAMFGLGTLISVWRRRQAAAP